MSPLQLLSTSASCFFLFKKRPDPIKSGRSRLSSPVICPHFSCVRKILSPLPQCVAHFDYSTSQTQVPPDLRKDGWARFMHPGCWGAAMFLCSSEKAVNLILSFLACSVPVLQVAFRLTRSFTWILLGRNCIVTRVKEAVARYHSVPECSRRRRLEGGKLRPWAPSLSLPSVEEERSLFPEALPSTKHLGFHVSLGLRGCPFSV